MVAPTLHLLLIAGRKQLKEQVKKMLAEHPGVSVQCADGIPENLDTFDAILSDEPLETLSSLADRTHLHVLKSTDPSDSPNLKQELERFLETVEAMRWIARTATQLKCDQGKWRDSHRASPSENVAASGERAFRPMMVAFGASTGGPQSLSKILPHFPSEFSLPIVLVQHAPPGIGRNMVDFLQQRCAIPVIEITHGMRMQRGHVYVAPGGCHTKLSLDSEKNPILLLNHDAPVNDCRPSVDVFFQSVVQVFGGSCIAALLTGMGSDGATGLKTLHDLGAITLVESKDSCTVFGMPAAAIRLNAVTRVLSAEDLALQVMKLVSSEVPHGR